MWFFQILDCSSEVKMAVCTRSVSAKAQRYKLNPRRKLFKSLADHARPLTPAFPRLGNLKTYGKSSRKLKLDIKSCNQGASNFCASSPLECSGIFFQFPEDISAIKGPRSKTRRSMRAIPIKPKSDVSTLSETKEDCGDVLSYLNSPPSSPILKVTRGMSAKVEDSKPDSPDCIITLDDDDEEEGEIPDYRDFDEGNLGQECLLYKNESVTLYDYQTLSEGEYINDSIINFYLTYLYEEKLSQAEKKQIHIFSSHFFSKLNQRLRKEPNSILSQSARRHEQVKKWTKKVDLFTKRLVIIPVCEENHWYLIIISNPGYIKLPKEAQIIQGNPYFLVLDSLGGNHASDISKLRSYLGFEYLEKHQNRISFGREKMVEIEPDVPQQTNSCDCGVYLLHYVELLFKNPGQFYWAKMRDLRSWFAESEVRHKREFLASLIQELALKANPNVAKFPNLKFARKQRSSKQGKKCNVSKSEERTTVSPQPSPPPTRFSARSAKMGNRPVYDERDDKDEAESEDAKDNADDNTDDDENADTDDDQPLSNFKNGRARSNENSPRIYTRSLLENLGATSDEEENDTKEEGSPRIVTEYMQEKAGPLPVVIVPEETNHEAEDTKETAALDPDPLEVVTAETNGEENSFSPSHANELFLSEGELEEDGQDSENADKITTDEKDAIAITLGSSSIESESDSESLSRSKKSSKKSKKRSRSQRPGRKKKRKSEKRKKLRRRESCSDESEDRFRKRNDRRKSRDKSKRSPSTSEESARRSSRRAKDTRWNSFRTAQGSNYDSLKVMVEQSDLPRVVTLTEDRPATHRNGSDPFNTFDQTNLLLQANNDSDSSLLPSSLSTKKRKMSHDIEETFYANPPLSRPVQVETEDEVEEVAQIRPRKFRLQRRNL
ncbi:uncharacterized protein LOC131882947 isoform X2 [Tigriopus californicus]|uniref:uncharacterized protein LOC131882947 isoform X2 n=1 Tax=Tigriopus californicus TaxID=6832 RepID=UPI0027DA714F|nr:uncharacterized protein LOC131882947 isoform X2 [Tigriopus californicus]